MDAQEKIQYYPLKRSATGRKQQSPRVHSTLFLPKTTLSRTGNIDLAFFLSLGRKKSAKLEIHDRTRKVDTNVTPGSQHNLVRCTYVINNTSRSGKWPWEFDLCGVALPGNRRPYLEDMSISKSDINIQEHTTSVLSIFHKRFNPQYYHDDHNITQKWSLYVHSVERRQYLPRHRAKYMCFFESVRLEFVLCGPPVRKYCTMIWESSECPKERHR